MFQSYWFTTILVVSIAFAALSYDTAQSAESVANKAATVEVQNIDTDSPCAAFTGRFRITGEDESLDIKQTAEGVAQYTRAVVAQSLMITKDVVVMAFDIVIDAI